MGDAPKKNVIAARLLACAVCESGEVVDVAKVSSNNVVYVPKVLRRSNDVFVRIIMRVGDEYVMVVVPARKFYRFVPRE